jgi:hypothetical protein
MYIIFRHTGVYAATTTFATATTTTAAFITTIFTANSLHVHSLHHHRHHHYHLYHTSTIFNIGTSVLQYTDTSLLRHISRVEESAQAGIRVRSRVSCAPKTTIYVCM